MRQQQQHGVVLRKRRAARAWSRRRCRAAARASRKKATSTPSAARDRVEPVGRQRLVEERRVGEPERRRGVGAAAAEAGGDRDPLLDPGAPARLDARGGRDAPRARARTSVSSAKPSTAERAARLERDVSRGRSAGAASRPRGGRRGRVGPTTSARLIFAGASARGHRRASRERDELGRLELLGARRRRSRPIASSAAAACSREATPGERERVGERLAAVRERRPRRARFTPAGRCRARCGGTRRAPSRRSAAGGTPRARRGGSRCARSRAGRARRPRRRPSCAATAKKRSATSRCTITHHELDARACGRGSRRRAAWRCCRAGSRRASPAAGRARPGRARARPPSGASCRGMPREAAARASGRSRPRGRARRASAR